MKVLFMMLAFPDMNKSFNMYTTIVEQFHKNGHEVFVLAPAAGQGPTQIVTEAGIRILRVKTLPVKNIPNVLKGIANVLLPYQFGRALKKYYPDITFDLIVSPTPPITLVDLISKLKKKNRCTFYLILRDIFPQNAVDLGFMRQPGFLYHYFRKKETLLYSIADEIGCMSEGNINYILRHNFLVEPKKLHVLENYQKLFQNYGNTDATIKVRYNLENKFVVVFGGNMGKPQQIENVLHLARQCEEYEDVLFILLGEGLQKKNIENQVERDGHRNIRMLNTIPKQEYQHLISACDIGLISLHKDFTIPNIPSKTLDYFNVGIPVLASIDKATDYGALLDSTRSGLWSLAGDHAKFKENFDRLYHDASLRKTMGRNGREYFESNLIPEKAFQTVIGRIRHTA